MSDRYTFGGKLIPFGEFTIEEKLGAIMDVLIETADELGQLQSRVDALIEKRPEIEPCSVCGKSEVGVDTINHNRTLIFCKLCNLKTSFIAGGCTPQEALVAWNKQSRTLRGLKP